MLDVAHSDTISGIYFIRNLDNKSVKIGKSKDILLRYIQIKSVLKNYSNSNCILERIIMCSPREISELEKEIHDNYKKHRLYGEFFDISVYNDKYTGYKNVLYREDLIVNYVIEPLIEYNKDKDIEECLSQLKIYENLTYKSPDLKTKEMEVIDFMKSKRINLGIVYGDKVYVMGYKENEQNDIFLNTEMYDHYDYILEKFLS